MARGSIWGIIQVGGESLHLKYLCVGERLQLGYYLGGLVRDSIWDIKVSGRLNVGYHLGEGMRGSFWDIIQVGGSLNVGYHLGGWVRGSIWDIQVGVLVRHSIWVFISVWCCSIW